MRYRVKRPHEASYEDPICVKAGEALTIEDRESEWPGWVWCVSASGRAGWVPLSVLAITDTTCQATSDYSAVELTLSEGQEVTGSRIESGWVWVSDKRGLKGWIPLECLQALGTE